MRVSEELFEQLMRDEGAVPLAYKDSLGHWTVGYGHNLETTPLTKRAMLVILEDDASAVLERVLARWPWMHGLDEARRDALVNVAFNIGVGGLAGFRKMLTAAERRDWPTAARELLDSKYAEQVGQRARRLARQLSTGERQ